MLVIKSGARKPLAYGNIMSHGYTNYPDNAGGRVQAGTCICTSVMDANYKNVRVFLSYLELAMLARTAEQCDPQMWALVTSKIPD